MASYPEADREIVLRELRDVDRRNSAEHADLGSRLDRHGAALAAMGPRVEATARDVAQLSAEVASSDARHEARGDAILAQLARLQASEEVAGRLGRRGGVAAGAAAGGLLVAVQWAAEVLGPLVTR